MGGVIESRARRVLVATGVVFVAVVVSVIGIWAVYGFRFRPTPLQGVYLNMTELASQAHHNAMLANGGLTTPNDFAVDAALFANQHGLLPQAFLAGFLFTYANAQAHPAFADGQISMVGWWWYFPFAMLVKTPLATIAAACIALLSLWKCVGRQRDEVACVSPSKATPDGKPFNGHLWTGTCLAMPVAIFLASAMQSHFNIGLRHILPIYPFAFVAIGWAISRTWEKRSLRIVSVALVVLLGVESLSSYPDFIPFFNRFSAGSDAAKLSLLGDSNLDWGQDLPLLAEWQHRHPDERIYLSYFGFADPEYYKIRYTPLPGGYHYDAKPRFPDAYERCVLAISATNLQGVLEPPELRAYYQQCQKLKVREILGGSIYLFDDDPSQNLRAR